MFDPSVSEIGNYEEFISLAQTRMKTLAEFKSLTTKDRDSELGSQVKELALRLREEYEKIDDWNFENISKISLQVRDELGCSTKDIFRALSGKSQGLPFVMVA